MEPVYLLFLYLAVINLTLFCVMGADKRRARRHRWRVRESTLFALCLLGGSLGGVLGMLVVRHKTRPWRVVLGFPAILLLHRALAGYALFCA